jgi:glycosyltransferase involved in cell wall biosynthesis
LVRRKNREDASSMTEHPNFLSGDGVRGLVTVVVPTYNRADLVVAAIDSARQQTYPKLEILVVDDGSSDGTRELVARISDDRLRYFFKDNGGLSSARNFGLEHARGEYIAFLDSDDIWFPWKLSAQVGLLERHPEAGMVWSDFSTFDEPGRILKERALRGGYAAYARTKLQTLNGAQGRLGQLSEHVPAAHRDATYSVGVIFEEMFLGNLVHPPTAIVRRQRARAAGPFEPHVTGRGGDDYHYYFRVTEKGAVALIDAPTMLYRIHPKQITNTHGIEEARADIRVLNYWMSRRPPRYPKRVMNSRYAAAHRWLGYEQWQADDLRAARSSFWRSLQYEPTNIVTAKWLMVAMLPTRFSAMLRSIRRAVSRHLR